MKISIVIPAHNEQESIVETVTTLHERLCEENIEHEILVINDNSTDDTENVVRHLQDRIPTIAILNNEPPNGFGFAVRHGLNHFTGDCVAVMMADLSDSPDDLVKFYRKMQDGYDCVFGNRWGKDGQVVDYPFNKKVLNRLANYVVKTTFRLDYNDCTNAFKLYRRETIDGLKPFLSPHFNLTLELPLKAIVRGYSFAVVPNSWRNRKTGESKLKVKEMGSRYFFILLYCLIEKYFSRGDFMKKD
jgi:dolichol-phosphate mannosyltransferase